MRASTFSAARLRQHVFIEREIGDDPLQARILVLELPHPAQLADAQVPVAFLPDVERGLADAELAADIGDRRAGFRLPERVGECSSENFDRFIDPFLAGFGPLPAGAYSSFRLSSNSGGTSGRLRTFALRRQPLTTRRFTAQLSR